MTVTELREALQALEAQGHGTLPVFIDVSIEHLYFYEPDRITIGKGFDGETCAIFDDTAAAPQDGSAPPRDA